MDMDGAICPTDLTDEQWNLIEPHIPPAKSGARKGGRPLGLAVVGGPLFSQALTLYVARVFYLLMESLRGWLGKALKRRQQVA